MLNTLDHSFNIIGLSETWVSSNKDSFVNPFLPGFDFICQPSKLSVGGVGLLIAYSLRYSAREDLNSSSDLEESLWIEVLNGTKKNIVCGIVYRHPNTYNLSWIISQKFFIKSIKNLSFVSVWVIPML